MAYWRRRPDNVKGYSPETFTLGDGVNTYSTIYAIGKTESYDTRNTSSRNYPALSVRPGTTLEFGTSSEPITTPNGAGVRNAQQLHIIDGTTWKYWNGTSWVNITTSLTDATATILEFNRETDRLTLMFNGNEKIAWDGTTAIDITEAPNTKLITIDDYRLYALSGSILQISAIYNPFDFTTFNDAVPNLVIAGMEGVGTAISAYQDIVICWSDKTMHLLYGDRFDNFQLMDPIHSGCVSNRSVIEHNAKLYFMDYNKFKVFTGGFPVEVSQKVRKYLENINYTFKENIVSGSQDQYIYISIPHGSSSTSNNLTLEFDTELGNWYVIDKGYTNFVNIGNELFGLKPNGEIEKMNNGTTDNGTNITWNHDTGVLNNTPISAKNTLSNIWIEALIPSGSSMIISYSEATFENWQVLQSITSNSTEQKVRVRVPTNILQSMDRYRLRFAGTGTSTVHFVELEERIRLRR